MHLAFSHNTNSLTMFYQTSLVVLELHIVFSHDR